VGPRGALTPGWRGQGLGRAPLCVRPPRSTSDDAPSPIKTPRWEKPKDPISFPEHIAIHCRHWPEDREGPEALPGTLLTTRKKSRRDVVYWTLLFSSLHSQSSRVLRRLLGRYRKRPKLHQLLKINKQPCCYIPPSPTFAFLTIRSRCYLFPTRIKARAAATTRPDLIASRGSTHDPDGEDTIKLIGIHLPAGLRSISGEFLAVGLTSQPPAKRETEPEGVGPQVAVDPETWAWMIRSLNPFLNYSYISLPLELYSLVFPP
jgi:hypothetical protein